MLTKRRSGTASKSGFANVVANAAATTVDRRAFLQKSGVAAGGLTALGAIPLGTVEKAEATGDGGYDAFINALKKAAKRFELDIPLLEDFKVRIPPGGRTTALVETHVTWRLDPASPAVRAGQPETFSTIGVDSSVGMRPARRSAILPPESSVQKFARMAMSPSSSLKPMPVASRAPRPMRNFTGS